MDISSTRGIRTIVRLTIFTICLLLLFSGNILTARADGGGWPTNTPTPIPPTPIPTSTPVPTTLPLLMLPAVSPTLSEGAAANLSILAPTPIPVESQRSPLSLVYCWPFALVVLAVLIIGIWWLRNRLAQDAYESMES